MIIGRMNKRIELQSFANKVWTTQTTVWAEFKKPSLATVEVAGNIASELIREINIRYNTNIRKGWRVVWEGHNYEVKHIYDYQKTATILVCREVVL